jgi:hypothetical protein
MFGGARINTRLYICNVNLGTYLYFGETCYPSFSGETHRLSFVSSVCLSVSLLRCFALSVCLSVSLLRSFALSVCVSVSLLRCFALSICLSVCLSYALLLCLSLLRCFALSVCLSVSLLLFPSNVEHRLRVCLSAEYGVLMGIFAPEGEEVTAGWTIINISLHQIP